jgi:membrane associated rhomboid family serine protease
MSSPSLTIPRPLVRTNQWVIVLCVVATWLTGWYALLLIPLVSGLLGVLWKINPIMRVAKLFLRKKSSEYIQEDRDDQNFNQTIAVFCLAAAFLGYLLGWPALAYIFSIMVAVAAFVAILGFCVGCFIRFQWKQYTYRRTHKM